jgi:hypothetical protein
MSSSSDLQPEFELVLHLVQHVAERFRGRPQQLDDVFARLEHGAERHRDDRVLAHHRLVDALVRQDVLASGVEHFKRRVRHDGAEILEVHRVDLRWIRADADRPEPERLGRLDNAVDIFAAARADRRVDCRRDFAAAQGLFGRAPVAPATVARGRRPRPAGLPPRRALGAAIGAALLRG